PCGLDSAIAILAVPPSHSPCGWFRPTLALIGKGDDLPNDIGNGVAFTRVWFPTLHWPEDIQNLIDELPAGMGLMPAPCIAPTRARRLLQPILSVDPVGQNRRVAGQRLRKD